VLSQQYGIEFWLERAYLDVCTADNWLSDEEGLRLGVVAVLKVGRARHELRTPATLQPESSRLGIVRAVFGLTDANGTPASISPSGSGSEADECDAPSHIETVPPTSVRASDSVSLHDEVDASSDNAVVPTPPPASDPDPESLQVSIRGLDGV
jgi:hypothetical protein